MIPYTGAVVAVAIAAYFVGLASGFGASFVFGIEARVYLWIARRFYRLSR